MDIEETCDRHVGSLWRHALALTRHRADAEDAVQEVFVRLARRLRAGTEIRDVEAYLHTAVRRVALDLIGRRRRGALPAARLVEPSDERRLEEAEEVDALLAGLPDEQREVVMLHVFEGMTFRRIGEVLAIPPDTAASRFRYARARLKEGLDGRR